MLKKPLWNKALRLWKPWRSVCVFLASLVLVLLTGCIDYQEEIWLNPDLSGKVAMTISIQEELVRGQTGLEKDLSEDGVRRDVERIPGVKLESFESFRDSGRLIAKLRIAFDSIEKLTRNEAGVAESSPVSLIGSIKIHEEGRKIILERIIQALPQAKGKTTGQDLLMKGLGSLLLSKSNLSYKLHVPGEIITANTQHIDGKDRTVEWNFTLAQALRDPPQMRVEWKKPFEWLWLLGGGCVLGLLVILAVKYKTIFH